MPSAEPRADRTVPRGRALRVLTSFPEPRPTTNPYIHMLAAALRATPGLEVRTFSWRTALLTPTDVFHAHWPEILVSGHSPLKALVRQVLTALLLIRFAITRTAIVRTVHNLELPSGISRRERALLRWFDRQTTLRIVLNSETPVERGASVVIPHGHYRDWFDRYPKPARVAGRLAYFGLIRRYKNVEGLLAAFIGAPQGLSLHVAGKPSGDGLAEALRELASRDDRIELSLGFVEDPDLARLVGESELVVLPYRLMHNSGGVLTALSLDRPVLVPDNPTNALLADEVGEKWVRRYEGELTQDTLVDAFAAAAAIDPSERPDLSARDWHDAGERHRDAFVQAVSIKRRGVRT